MSYRLLAKTLLPLFSFGLVAEVAWAHHGWAGTDPKQFELTGTVTKALSLAGAHARLQIEADGKLWEITLAPPARTQLAGLQEDTIPLGAKVTVSGHRSSNPENYEIKTERVTYESKVYNVYPERE